LRRAFVRATDGNTKVVSSMPLRIRVSDPVRADELLDYLRHLGADARREGEAIKVWRRHPVLAGEPPTQDRIELEFILRAWANGRPGTVFEVEEAA
jgi:hypothetical protein